MTLLNVDNLTKNFGGLTAISHVDLEINNNELIGLIGPNGAGKTTLFNLLTGVYVPSEGSISFKPNDEVYELSGKNTSQIGQMGIARTFQNIRLFKDLSVLENVRIGMHTELGANVFQSFFRTKEYYRTEVDMTEKAMELLKIFNMEDKANYKASNLPYGDQRKLEIVRALGTNPKLLFLDEPAAGMNARESRELTQLIQQIHEEFDLAVVLIEHDMKVIMNISERIYVLEYGKKIAEGTPQEIQQNEYVIRAYLGGD
ncbi:MAG TPA: ABC transporter ATP-binding protein [Atopostipes sp.]|nr:ABC transporter ATP-binding protein [Atopostipes sp.]